MGLLPCAHLCILGEGTVSPGMTASPAHLGSCSWADAQPSSSPSPQGGWGGVLPPEREQSPWAPESPARSHWPFPLRLLCQRESPRGCRGRGAPRGQRAPRSGEHPGQGVPRGQGAMGQGSTWARRAPGSGGCPRCREPRVTGAPRGQRAPGSGEHPSQGSTQGQGATGQGSTQGTESTRVRGTPGSGEHPGDREPRVLEGRNTNSLPEEAAPSGWADRILHLLPPSTLALLSLSLSSLTPCLSLTWRHRHADTDTHTDMQTHT